MYLSAIHLEIQTQLHIETHLCMDSYTLICITLHSRGQLQLFGKVEGRLEGSDGATLWRNRVKVVWGFSYIVTGPLARTTSTNGSWPRVWVHLRAVHCVLYWYWDVHLALLFLTPCSYDRELCIIESRDLLHIFSNWNRTSSTSLYCFYWHTHGYIYMYINKNTCAYICMYILCVCIHIHTYTHR